MAMLSIMAVLIILAMIIQFITFCRLVTQNWKRSIQTGPGTSRRKISFGIKLSNFGSFLPKAYALAILINMERILGKRSTLNDEGVCG
jgi:hypothetical protein